MQVFKRGLRHELGDYLMRLRISHAQRLLLTPI
jgi:transcriptional regulator GlxA family with amidase domain